MRPRMIAVAYVGPDSVTGLKLQKGDVLHCALSLRNAKAGIVCPGELKRLRKQRVRLFASESLHAKIYLFGKTAIVGSANLSRRSQVLDEAGLLTTDKTAVAEIRRWFKERQDEEISDAFLEKCNKVYRPPSWNPFETKGSRERSAANGGSVSVRASGRITDSERWWFLWDVGPADYDEDQDRLAKQANTAAKKRVGPQRWASLVPILWIGKKALKEMQVGDKIVCAEPKGRGQVVTPWGTCQGLRRGSKKSGGHQMVISGEFPQSDARLAFKDFVRSARAAGLPMGLKGGSRVYDNPEHVRILRSLTSARALVRG